MTWQLSIYSLLLGLATLISVAVCVISWRRRDREGSKIFFVLMIGVSLWAAGNTLQLLTADYELKLLFRTIGYVGHNIAPIVLLAFALVLTGHAYRVRRRTLALLAAEPLTVGLLVTPTNALGWHQLLWTNTSLMTANGIVVLERSFGPWYWLNTAYNYALIFVALTLFLWLAIQSHAAVRKQGLALIGGIIPPFVANVAWISGVSPVDYTPVAFSITGIMFAVAVYRYRLFDIVPVAHETVLDALDDGYVVLDRNGHVTDINETARQHVSAVDDPIGRPAETVIPHSMSLVDKHQTDMADNGVDGPVTGEVRLENDDETPRYYEVRISAISRPQFRGRLVLFQNITEQREVERRYRALIENASDLVAVIDEDGYYTYHSPSSTRILGYDPEDLVGEPFARFIHPDDRQEVFEEFAQGVENPDYLSAHEFRFRHRDGSWRWIESRGRNRLDHPLIDGVVVNSRDVTERKRQEALLRQRNDRLQTLASVASHDLRNPLQVISGHIQLAQETGDAEHFEVMENAVERMQVLVEDVVTLAREGVLVKDTEEVDLATVARESWESIEAASVTFVVEFESMQVTGDRSKLLSLFTNLFTNAIDHGAADEIRVGALSNGFYVEDNGEGIDEETRSQMFERGFSTEPEGSGLGLPIVQSIATAHRWDVSIAESADGTRFEITGVDTTPDSDQTSAVGTD
jgi:PAS domain S-box-containing protein